MSVHTSLRRAHPHLAGHRKKIVAGALLAAAAGLVPAPIVDEWAARLLRRRTIRALAEARQVDLADGAAETLADRMGASSPGGTWAGSIARRVLGRFAGRVLLAIGLVGQAREAARTFAALTLFDHYLARLHVGGPLEPEAARVLAGAVREAVEADRTGVLERLFERVLARAARGVVFLPVRALDAASGGLLGKLWRRGAAAAEPADDEPRGGSRGSAERGAEGPPIEHTAAAAGLGRVTQAIEDALGRAGSGWQAELVDAFEAAWRQRRPEGT